ncbi:hypothetical protein ATANTOWER_027106 [Ataeniobius toweri]|uniref:Uncharacterized protein n=1 Tax=Ataeniobius toweri TaxID=208326 RepID=A0ABU7B9L0_9TELE|nr:hypothetical protein [Ataeniobius toweri]
MLGRSSTVTQLYSVIKLPPTLRGEQTKGYKTFGGKLASSEVEDKENGEFHHEVILTVQSHSAPALALRCSITPQNTHKAGERSGLQTSNTAHQSFNKKGYMHISFRTH